MRKLYNKGEAYGGAGVNVSRLGKEGPHPNPLPEGKGERKKKSLPEGEGSNGRWRAFSYDELVARDKTNWDIFWLKDESLEDTDNLPAPAVLAAEIVEQLEAALEEFRSVEEVLVGNGRIAGSGLATT